MRRVLGLGAGVFALVLAGCAQSETTLDDTLPTIAPVPTTTSTTTTTIAMIPITAGATAVATTAPAPTAAPAPAPTAAPAAPTPTPGAGGGATATTATTAAPAGATTTTSLLAPTLSPIECTAAALNASDPARIHAEPVCVAGWAVEVPIADAQSNIFRAGQSGWTPAGTLAIDCPAPLVALGMPMAVALQLAMNDCGETAATEVIRPKDEGPAVQGVQVALVARGYGLETDGVFGPRTEAAVRHFQSTVGLEADGLVGPATQSALFAPTPTDPVDPAELLACTAAALDAAEPGQTHTAPTCRAGWALEAAGDVGMLFIAGPDGWEPVGEAGIGCPKGLVEVGVPVVVATAFVGTQCDEPDGPSVIRVGDRSTAVRGVQAALVARGFDVDTDGVFGPGTEAAVKEFQTSAGLAADGLVGPATQEALFAAT